MNGEREAAGSFIVCGKWFPLTEERFVKLRFLRVCLIAHAAAAASHVG